MWKHIAANALTLGVVLIAALAGIIQIGKSRWAEPGPLEAATFFEVPRGSNMREVSTRLAEDGIVSSGSIFRIGTGYAERDGDLKFGTYEIPSGASMPEVLDILTAGGPSVFPYTVTYMVRQTDPEIRVRERIPGQDQLIEIATFAPDEEVPEEYTALLERGVPITWRVSVAPGLTSWDIINGLESVDFLDGTDMPVPPEGTLAPDTYDVARGSSAEELVNRMRVSQERILADAWASRAPNLPITSPEEALILASIIEKETAIAEERRRVAAVFINRLNQGMRLQTDPTVIYGITKGEGGPLGRGIRQSELRAETPYNTYVIDGLPPTPIANPGAEAIRAALDPEQTNEIFFVADGTGGHLFAETLAEHNQNVAAWRAIEAAREAAEGAQTGN